VEVEHALAFDECVGTDGVVACGKRRDLDVGAELAEGLRDAALLLMDIDHDPDR
jgi:hypothetical protein